MLLVRKLALAGVFLISSFPAHAGGWVFDLPRLTFPEPEASSVDKDCTDIEVSAGCAEERNPD